MSTSFVFALFIFQNTTSLFVQHVKKKVIFHFDLLKCRCRHHLFLHYSFSKKHNFTFCSTRKKKVIIHFDLLKWSVMFFFKNSWWIQLWKICFAVLCFWLRSMLKIIAVLCFWHQNKVKVIAVLCFWRQNSLPFSVSGKQNRLPGGIVSTPLERKLIYLDRSNRNPA